jgi:hypothetical protein
MLVRNEISSVNTMPDQATITEEDVLSEIEKYLKRLEVRYGRTKLGENEVIGAPWVIDE